MKHNDLNECYCIISIKDFVTINKFISILLQFLPYFLIFDIIFEVKEDDEEARGERACDN